MLSISVLVVALLSGGPTAPDQVRGNAGAAAAPSPCTGTASLCEFFQGYIAAFNARDLARFIGTFAEDASVMFDLPRAPERRDGRAAIEAVFRPGFLHFHPTDGRAAPALPPPLVPMDLRVQEYGDFAVLSFVMRSPEDIARRTVAVRRTKDGAWQVIHVHASSFELPTTPAP